jgi:hypothetical protein
VTSRVGPPPRPDLLLLGDDPLLVAVFDGPLDGPDKVWIIQEGFLLLQPAISLALRIWTGSLAGFGSAVNERDFRTGMRTSMLIVKPEPI